MADPTPPSPQADFDLDSALKNVTDKMQKAATDLGTAGGLLLSSTAGLKDFVAAVMKSPPTQAALGDLIADYASAGLAAEAQEKLTEIFDKAMAKPIEVVKKLVQEGAKDTAEVANVLMDFSGMSADAVMRAEFGIDSVTRKASIATYDMIKNIEQTEITLLDGTKRYVSMYVKPLELAKNFSDAVLDDTRLYLAASVGMNDQMILAVTEAKDRLGMTAGDINEIMQRELSATGKVTGEFLDRQMKTMLAAAEVAGVNIPKLRHDMVVMYSDMDHYGMLADEQMVSLSNTVQHLGLDITDVTRLADKFSSFDSAIQTVNQLTAATGATLETTQLFELANTDPEEFVNELRAQLDAAGVEFDNLNQIQKRSLAQTLGIDQGLLQRLTNDNIEAVESISESTGAAADAMSTEEMNRRLISMRKVEAEKLSDFTKNQASIEQLSIKTAMSIEKAYSSIANKTTEAYDAAFSQINGQVNLVSQKTAKLRADIDSLAGAITPNYIPPSAVLSPPAAPVKPAPPTTLTGAATASALGPGVTTTTATATTATQPPPAASPPPRAAPANNAPIEIILKVKTDSNLDFLRFEHAEKSFQYDGMAYKLRVDQVQ